MHLSFHLLGSAVAKAMAARATAPVLVIGRDRFTRADLAGVACFNFTAAANLSAILAGFKVADTKALFETIPPTALVLPRLGAVSLATLGAAFEAKGLGGEAPLEAWYVRHRPEGATREYVTFHTLKAAEAKREAGEKRAARARTARTATRRDVAQHLRGDRFLKRRGQGRDVQ